MSRRPFLMVVSLAVFLLCAGIFTLLFGLPAAYRWIHPSASRVVEQPPPGGSLPEEVQLVSQEQLDRIVQATLQALLPPAPAGPTLPAAPAALIPTSLPSATVQPSATPTASSTATPTATTSPSPTASPPPESTRLSGVRNEVETRNNRGPATLAMALSYWGWQGDQTVTQAVLRPNPRVDDKNVMPQEMAAFVQSQTGLRALVRFGGDLDTLRRLIAAGFLVIVEKGHITTGWIGHYVLLTGYDDRAGQFLSQDSLIVSPDVPVPYEELAGHWWRHFNYLYLVIYPPEREQEVLSSLGPQADPAANFQSAAEKARQEIPQLEGRELFFAWYNLGSSLVGLGDYAGAAAAYDTAYDEVYPTLSKEKRPWRAPWYQTGPYQAYYYAGRYQEVIDLANSTLTATGSPVLEETFYWRGKAREALGDLKGALSDYRKAVELNPNSTPAGEELQRLGD